MKSLKILLCVLFLAAFLPCIAGDTAAEETLCTALAEAETATLLAAENADTPVPGGAW